MQKGCLSFILVFSLVSVSGYSAELETVNRLQSLSSDKRMELLIEGAKKEREVVWYGNWELDYLKPLPLASKKNTLMCASTCFALVVAGS